jgi:hypothetical protein
MKFMISASVTYVGYIEIEANDLASAKKIASEMRISSLDLYDEIYSTINESSQAYGYQNSRASKSRMDTR